jgi:putative transposase
LKFRKNAYTAQKRIVLKHIQQIYHSENGKMGYRMIKRSLEKQGTNLSLLTVHKYMKELNIKSVSFRKRPNYVKGTSHKVFSNILNRNFTAVAKNLKWCTDFTYIHLSSGRIMYNCSILDLYDRGIVATRISSNITAELAIDTLSEAIANHKPPTGLIIHSDQGSQYTSKAFTSFARIKKCSSL